MFLGEVEVGEGAVEGLGGSVVGFGGGAFGGEGAEVVASAVVVDACAPFLLVLVLGDALVARRAVGSTGKHSTLF